MNAEYESLPPKHLPRDEASRRRHRRESLLQIGLPLTIGAILLVALVSWLLASGSGEVGSLAQIATMMLALIALFFGLIMLVGFVLMIYALARLMNWLPPQAFHLQRAMRQVNARIIQAADIAAKPVLLLDSWQKAAERIWRRRS